MQHARLLRKQSGFTLVEMAIMLMVMGFLVAGVLLGQSLLKNSQMRGVLNDVERFDQAVEEFQTVFNMLPGDVSSPGGAALWTAATACYGDGDGVVEYQSATACGAGVTSEWFAAWRHLSYQGLVNGQFTGSPAGVLPDIGTNVPVSDINGAGFSFYNITNATAAGHTVLPAENYVGLYIAFGGVQTGAVAYGGGVGAANQNLPYLGGSAITPEQARAIDMKADDGIPDDGRILGTPVAFGRCTSAIGGGRYVYDNTAANQEARVCNLFFRLGGQ